ncbi:PREDICTED: pentatricopeptide repeat-containing protein At4g02750 [Tarenaya hassleriana]|uniref:pentatricopeptide repeat-containing protein At4g02750 n=1 Tax=Tarenaya hassleriana TaxID=28532 RepID=UPI00053C3D57|nr:PREDICTED: pentatricopeptide repeat-containing protein At4g02750 [Tarenaya hassleriana]
MRRTLSWQTQRQQQRFNGFQAREKTNIVANQYPPKRSTAQIQKSRSKPPPKAGDADIKGWNIAISGYMRDGRCDAALRVFNDMPRRSSVSYNAMISGYLMNGELVLARKLFDEMPERDPVSWNVIISGYVRNRNLGMARELFERMFEKDACSWNTMLSGYAQNGCVDEARRIFDRMPEKNEVSWNALLSAYVQNGRMEEACVLFESRKNWALVSWNCLLGGFVKKKRIVEARQLFDDMPLRDVISWNTIITGYAQNSRIDEARKLFDESPVRDVFTWTAMVSGYVQNGLVEEAREMFDEMPKRNEVSWNAMIAGYVHSKRMDMAKELFDVMPCRNVTSWNTMITGYAQCSNISEAKNLFDKMPRRDPVSWAAMVAGYSQCGYSEEALNLFVQMEREGGRLNRSSFSSALSTCADIAALELGKQLHGRLVKVGYETGCFVGNALLLMYCKCGSIEEAYDAFEEIAEKDVVSWNTMIAGYARHGFGEEALRVFESMKRQGLRPDDATLVAVLSACSHTGLVDKGRQYFYKMTRDYGIKPNSQHYTCMVDLLGRAGCLEEAQNLMNDMPFEPDAATWGALLGASRIHGNTEVAETAAEKIFEMEPENPGMYILLSNLYAASARWSDVGKMRVRMRDKGVKKIPGFSWIEIQNKIHTFSVGDELHPERNEIYAFMEDLDLRLKKEGYVTSTRVVLHDVEEEEKEHMVRYHSERLAVAYGIMRLPSGRPIRVMKNLRVCEDCHNAIKHITKITGRVIILRDNHRFHHFKDGSCSCGDYW